MLLFAIRYLIRAFHRALGTVLRVSIISVLLLMHRDMHTRAAVASHMKPICSAARTGLITKGFM
jgi:hypothetical protein